MTKKNPYEVIKHRHITEKTNMLGNLKTAESNLSLKRCKSPKYVFIVDRKASKQEIALAFQEIYKENDVKVIGVNTINIPAKRRRFRGHVGYKSAFKKAVITLRPDDNLDNV